MRLPVRAIGIDLGTCSTRVAILENGKVDVLPSFCGKNTIASYVSFSRKQRFIGDEAKNQLTMHPSNTVYHFKRMLGRQFKDQDLQEDMLQWPFKVVKENDHPFVDIDCLDEPKRFAPEEITAMLLRRIKEIAESHVGEEVTHAVISVPASFTDAQRRATQDAGIIAGFSDVSLVNEPTAACIGYYHLIRTDCMESKTVLVFDFGGGKADSTVAKIEEGTVQVLAASGNSHLGGVDLDNRLVAHLKEEVRRKCHKDITTFHRALAKLRSAAEKAKLTLSVCTDTGIDIESLCDDDTDFSTHITRARFEELCMNILLSAVDTAKTAVQLSGVGAANIEEVFVTGGSGKIPMIQQLLRQAFPNAALRLGDDSCEPVVCGAAIQAAMWTQVIPSEPKIREVIPHALLYGDENGAMDTICDANSKIPLQKTLLLPCPRSSLPSPSVVVYEERDRLGEFQVVGLSHRQSGFSLPSSIELTFAVDADGVLSVSAAQKDGELSRKVTVKADKFGFQPEDIVSMRQDVDMFHSEDALKREKLQARNELESFVFSLKHAAEYAPFDTVNPEERQQVLRACKEILDWLQENEYTDTDEYVFTLRHAKKQFEHILVKLHPFLPVDVTSRPTVTQRCSATGLLHVHNAFRSRTSSLESRNGYHQASTTEVLDGHNGFHDENS